MGKPNFTAFMFRPKPPADRAKEALLTAMKHYEGMSIIYDKNPNEENWVRLQRLFEFKKEREEEFLSYGVPFSLAA